MDSSATTMGRREEAPRIAVMRDRLWGRISDGLEQEKRIARAVCEVMIDGMKAAGTLVAVGIALTPVPTSVNLVNHHCFSSDSLSITEQKCVTVGALALGLTSAFSVVAYQILRHIWKS